MKSNVALRSNVYINKTTRRNDPDFVHHLRDYNTLRKYYDPVYRTSEVPLTPIQYEIIAHGPPKCSLESGTMSWGVPVGSERFVCRCEKTDCPRYAICSAGSNFEQIVREPASDAPEQQEEMVTLPPLEPELFAEAAPVLPKTDILAELAISRKDEHPLPDVTVESSASLSAEEETHPHESTAGEEPSTELDICEAPSSETATLEQAEPQAANPSYSTQDSIIHADTDTRILVNAAPGTGKTHIVIKRLQKLIQGSNIEQTILVLCFSKNAVHVIQERLRAEIGNTIDGLIADEQLIIRTFDSFATYMLADELPKGLDYDSRIEQFIQSAAKHPDILDDVEYMIVDEVQDTVGVRARMLKFMIENSHCGVLLLGDRCQAIYDWSTRSSNDWTSAELFDWVSRQGFQTCELTQNHRQAQALSSLGDTMRQSLLYDSEETQEQVLEDCKTKIETLWRGYKMRELPQQLLQHSELILCKTNGEAAVMSDLLFGRAEPISHTVMQNAGHKSLAPWIGMILGGCMAPIVSKDDFAAKAQTYGMEDIDTKWDALLSLDSHKRSAVLHRQEVLMRLAAMDSLPEVCLNHPGSGVVVSTVHRAKGSEADHVYWLNSPLVFENQPAEEGTKSDALKASYVAVTRAKQDIRLIHPTKQYLRSINGDRWIKTGFSVNKRPFCSGIALQPEDVDLSSCALGANAQEIQEMICSLTPGLDVKLFPSSDGTYFDILIDDYSIGRTSSVFMRALQEGFRSTNRNSNLPYSIDSAYISSLVTVIQLGGTNGENAYQASGCWLGYELGGFAHINYT